MRSNAILILEDQGGSSQPAVSKPIGKAHRQVPPLRLGRLALRPSEEARGIRAAREGKELLQGGVTDRESGTPGKRGPEGAEGCEEDEEAEPGGDARSSEEGDEEEEGDGDGGRGSQRWEGEDARGVRERREEEDQEDGGDACEEEELEEREFLKASEEGYEIIWGRSQLLLLCVLSVINFWLVFWF